MSAIAPGAGLAASLLAGYLLGSIPFGVIATGLAGAGDIRKFGSGNIGATNVLRTGRRDLALVTLLGDAGKGAAAVLLAGALVSPIAAAVAGGGAFLGHLFPVWLKFRGGKGLAVFFGILLAIAWPAGLAAGASWIAVAAIFRFSSLAALAAATLAPLFVFILDRTWDARLILVLAMAVLIFIRHHQNIARLARGVEPRIGEIESKAAP
ncbi:MAG: glycerol-3-phosphate 1-O-acyltransferase PlsY [Caulobacteraceae bacterium]